MGACPEHGLVLSSRPGLCPLWVGSGDAGSSEKEKSIFRGSSYPSSGYTPLRSEGGIPKRHVHTCAPSSTAHSNQEAEAAQVSTGDERAKEMQSPLTAEPPSLEEEGDSDA